MRFLPAALTATLSLAALGSYGQSASQTFIPVQSADVNVYFSTDDEGEDKPILWGLDTAWASEENIRRGVRYMGADIIDVARVSFQPIDFLSSWTLSDRQETNLIERLRLISLINGVGGVKVVLNNDTPDGMYNEKLANSATDPAACEAYANVIYATALSCQEKGWEVITASPLNEPDYEWNLQGSQDDFLAIAKKLKTYPQFSDGSIRISGGNTLNCDCAQPWYEYLYDYIDEGNTHQLAGSFNNYASFFEKVRADGKYATADELHNIMEAMVGVEYGMQTGIWWGTAELARGEFCKASYGKRLAYEENRKAWTSAGVYRSPEGKIQGFVGTSERQALECGYRFVSKDRDVFFNGHGPQREFYTSTPGGTEYQVKQKNAECVIDITWGEDVSPVIDGTYKIMNKLSSKVIGINGDVANLTKIGQYADGHERALNWEVKPTDSSIGGDYSYWTIKVDGTDNMQLDVNNWTLEDGGEVIIYNGGLGNNEQWWLRYVGDGYFRIFSRHSALCLALSYSGQGNSLQIVQKEPAEGDDTQLWRFLPVDAECEQEAPVAPIGLKAESSPGAIFLTWNPSASEDAYFYIVLRAGEDGEYTTLARDLLGTSFVDNMAIPGVEYSYKVKASDYSCNTSEASEAVTSQLTYDHALIGQWLFNQSLEDCSGYGNDAQYIANQNVRYIGGQEDKYALNLSSTTKFVQLPYSLANRKELTVSTWIQMRTPSGVQPLCSMERDADHYFQVYVDGYGYVCLDVMNGDNDKLVKSNIALPSKEWAHVAVTVSLDNVAVYVNGEVSLDEDWNEELTPAAAAPALFYVGSSMAVDTSNLSAYLQDMRVYNYALDASEIASTMDLAGISLIQSDESDSGEYYNLQGIRIPGPIRGFFIHNGQLLMNN